MKTKPFLILILALVAIAVYLGFRGESTSQAKVFNCAEYVSQPNELVLYCADAGQILQDIKWSSWTEEKAVGSATVTTNLCEPTCADGNTETTNVEVEMSLSQLAISIVPASCHSWFNSCKFSACSSEGYLVCQWW